MPARSVSLLSSTGRDQLTAHLQWDVAKRANFAPAPDNPRVIVSYRTGPKITLDIPEEPGCMERSNRHPELLQSNEVYVECEVNGAAAVPMRPSAADRADR